MRKKSRVSPAGAEGLHEIKNKYRARVVKKKRKGLVFTERKKHRILKTCMSLSAIFVLLLGVFSIAMAFWKEVPNFEVPEGFETVSYEPPTDGSTPLDYDALKNVGFMNYRFRQHDNWYCEMHGITNTLVSQSVNTFKQYSNGVLIMADVTSSSMVKAGRQFCYVGDEVMWREVATKSECTKAGSLEEMETIVWNSELKNHMTISAFKTVNGLPGTEMLVYVINEDTIDHADPVVQLSSEAASDWDGASYADKPIYSQTLYLRPGDYEENLGAAAYYAKQMKFTGGLTDYPVFDYITVTFTFDSSWNLLRMQVKESYTATVGVTAPCTSEFTSNYEYDTPKALSSAYEDYFKDFVGKDINDDVKQGLDAVGCLTSAFLSKPSTFEIDLTVNGRTANGVIALDASKLDIAGLMGGGSIDINAILGSLGLKARIGSFHIYLEGTTAYIGAGDLKVKLPIDELLDLILPNEDPSDGGASAASAYAATDEVSLFEMGELVEEVRDGKKYAHLHADLNLSKDLTIPLEFDFAIDENQKATLNYLTLDLDYAGITANVTVKDTKKTVPELGDKNEYLNLLETKQIKLSGSVSLSQPVDVAITVNEAIISWKNGFNLYVDASLRFGRTEMALIVKADESSALVNLGGVSLELVYGDMSEIGDEIVKLYNRVADAVNPISKDELLPQIKAVDDLLTFLTSVIGMGGDGGLYIPDFAIKGSEKENGLLCITLFGMQLDLIDDSRKGGILSLTFGIDGSSVQAEGGLSVSLYDGEIPEIGASQHYLGTDEIIGLIDTVSAVFGVLEENYFRFEISGEVNSAEKVKDGFGNDTATNKYPDGKYAIDGEIEFYSGENTAVHFEVDNKALWVDTEAYLRVRLNMTPKTADDKGIYVELFMLDCDTDGKKDGVLDIYLSISMRKNNTDIRPLNIYAPADELMPIISSLVAMLGVDAEIVTDYLFAPWLDVETTGELQAFGRELKVLLAGLLGGASATSEQEGTAASEIVKLAVLGNKFELELSTGFSLTIGREKGENGSRLSMISVKNIASGNESVSIAANLSYTQREDGLKSPSFGELFELKGVANLLKMLSHSVTHKTSTEVISGEEKQHEYSMNEYFYIDGSIELDINVFSSFNISSVKIKLVALSITLDENGVWGVNVRFQYDAVKALGLFTVINGDTTVDLTGKDNMVYIKRVQTSDASGKPYPVPVTVYRVMPLKNFGDDLINQMGFLFNLGSIITDNLAGLGGSDGNTTEKPDEDIGTTFWNLFKGFTVNDENDTTWQELEGDLYKVTVNGGALVDGLKDITVRLGSDKEGKLRKLGLEAELSTTGIAMKARANFTFRNPCGEMDAGVRDQTEDIEAVASEAMDKALHEANESNWEGLTYIEGETTTISYSVFGEVVSTQEVFFNTRTGECYAVLKAPEVSIPGYTVKWELPDRVSANLVIYGTCTPNTYEITLHDARGALEDVTWEYTYGDDIAEKLSELEMQGYRIIDASSVTEEAILNGKTEFTVVWQRYDYIVTYLNEDGTEYTKQYYVAGEAINLASAPEKVGLVGVWYQGGEKVENGAPVTENMTLTLHYEENLDPVVRLRLYSDVRFTYDGRESSLDYAAEAYYVDVEINTAENDVLPTLTANGYQQMGWWYFDGTWSQKTSAKKLNGARLWAMWIQDIKVKITEFYTNKVLGMGSQYNIGGMTTGGRVFGKTGQEIYGSLNMEETAEAVFYIRGAKASDSVDNCGGKASVTITYDSNGIGSFMRTGMNSWDYRDMWPAGKASYGGVVITKTLSYNGMKITTESGAIVSYDTVTVTFLDYDGTEYATVEVRLDCPFDEYDSATYLDEIVPAVREIAGYTRNIAPHVAVTENTTFALYSVGSSNLSLQSADAVYGESEIPQPVLFYGNKVSGDEELAA